MSSLRNSYGRIANPVRVPLAQALTRTGILGGDSNMSVDGSITPVEFFYQPVANDKATLYDFSIQISDVGNTTENDYGRIVGPLTNGIQFFARINNVTFDFGTPVLRAAQFFARGANVEFVELSGNKRIAHYQFSFFGISDGTVLNGQNGDRFGARVRDNLSSLTVHTMSIGGFMQQIIGS